MRLAVSGGQPLLTFWLLMFALSLIDFLSLLWSPSTNTEIFYFCQKYHLKDKYKIFNIIHNGLKFEWGLTDKYWLSWERLPVGFFLVACVMSSYTNMLVTTQWPQKRAPHLTSLVWVCVEWKSKRSLELAALCVSRFVAFTVPDSKIHGANMGPIWGRQDPSGPHVGPMNFAIWGDLGRVGFYWKSNSEKYSWLNFINQPRLHNQNKPITIIKRSYFTNHILLCDSHRWIH